ncbi:MAG: hypothetical protein QMC67_03555 [Candidatus Wallbacteria bacterium]
MFNCIKCGKSLLSHDEKESGVCSYCHSYNNSSCIGCGRTLSLSERDSGYCKICNIRGVNYCVVCGRCLSFGDERKDGICGVCKKTK